MHSPRWMFTGLCSPLPPSFSSLFFFTHSTSNLFIYLSFRLQSNTSSQDLIGSTGTGSHALLAAASIRVCVCVCEGAAKMPNPAAWWSPPPTNLPPPAKGKSVPQEGTAVHIISTCRPHLRLRNGFRAAGGSAGAAVNQQINSQTDQSRPPYLHANGRTRSWPIPGLLESNRDSRGNHFSHAGFVLPICPCGKNKNNSRTHLHIQGYQASSSCLIIFFPTPPTPRPPAQLTLSFLSSLSFVNQGHPKPLPPLLYGLRGDAGVAAVSFRLPLTDA